MKALKLMAGAVLAFSMTASVALADTTATVKTSTDFTDLAGVDAGLKAKIDELLAKGIFEGTGASTFGIGEKMTRAQFAKVLDLVYGIKVDMNVTASSFTDVQAGDPANGWAIPYVEAAKEAGLIDGVTDTTFVPGGNVTIGQFATALVKGLGRKVDFTGMPWYANVLQDAKNLKLLPADADGAKEATRADLVAGAYEAATNYGVLLHQSQPPLSMLDAKAIDATSVKVTFDREVDSSKATLTLRQGTSVIPTTAVWAPDNKSATLTLTGASLTTGDYSVTIDGINTGFVKTGTVAFRYESTGGTVSTGSINYASDQSLVLANVIDSGLTGQAGTGLSVSKADAEDPVKSKFAKELVFTATTASGDKIALPGIVQSMASSNTAVVKTGVSADHRGYVLGVKAGTAQITAVIQTSANESKPISVTVTVKDDAVTVAKVEAGNTSATPALTVTGSVYSFNAYAADAMNLTVTDTYGIAYENADIASYNFALGIVYTVDQIDSDPAAGAAGTVAVDGDGTVRITGNVIGFNLSAVSASGQKASTYVTVRK